MAVAEFPAQPIAIPRRPARVAGRTGVAPNLAWIPLVGVLLGIASLFYLAQTGDVANTGYDIQQLQAEVAEWEMRNEQLSLEMAKARALPRIEAEATKRLLMVPARDPVYLKGGAADSSSRGVPTNRGDSRSAPALEKPMAAISDPLDPVRSSVSALIPRAQPASR